MENDFYKKIDRLENCFFNFSSKLKKYEKRVNFNVDEMDIVVFSEMSISEKKKTLKKGRGPGSVIPLPDDIVFNPADKRLFWLMRDFYFFKKIWEIENHQILSLSTQRKENLKKEINLNGLLTLLRK